MTQNLILLISLTAVLLAGCGKNRESELEGQIKSLQAAMQSDNAKSKERLLKTNDTIQQQEKALKENETALREINEKLAAALSAETARYGTSRRLMGLLAGLQEAAAQQASSLSFLDEQLEKWADLRHEYERALEAGDDVILATVKEKLETERKFSLGYLQSLEESHAAVWEKLLENAEVVYGVGPSREKIAIEMFRSELEESQETLRGLRKTLEASVDE